MELFEELKWRGLVDNVTSDEVEDVINNGEVTFYIGTDPTADSLHIGHYSSLLMAKRLEKHGHHPIMLVGGATGFIGDPKATGERSMLTPEVLKLNYDALHAQISKLWGFDMVNNLDWTKDITIIDFLRDYGKLFNVNYMLNKETVKKRLDSGISYTEFSYMILQSLDFLNLYQTRGCTMQIGGQDQWGNITSGLELIRKKCGADVKCYGLTMPLITKADGTKFGKSETGTVWLDPKKTSPYELYQFLFNTDDSKVIEYLKKLTFLTKEEIDALEESLKEEGFRLVTGGTDNHLLLIDVKSSCGITGKKAQRLLDEINITANKNAIPFDTEKPFKASGIRVGTPAMTTKGFKEDDFREVGKIIAYRLKNEETDEVKNECLARVKKLTDKVTMYDDIKY